jgi:FKBP-type peptidyl-prolyl cis-trans isomerase FklB
MRISILVIAMVMAIFGANAQSKKKIKLKTENDSVSYSIGVSIGNALKGQGMEELNPEIIAAGMNSMVKGQPGPIDIEAAETFLKAYFAKKQEAESAKKIETANKFLSENKKNKGVTELPSGLQYIVLTEGTGEKPSDTSFVKVHYVGMFPDGKIFDNSYDRGEPAEFSVVGVIPGFSEAIRLMNQGSKWKIFIPPHLGYGEQGAGGVIGPNELLIFEIELLEITEGPTMEEEIDIEDIIEEN